MGNRNRFSATNHTQTDNRTMKIKDNIAAEFDEFSKNYTNDMRGVVPHYDFLLSCFSKGYDKSFNPIKILDMGCGNGNVTSQLLQLFPKAHYTLLDASQEMLEHCKKRFKNAKISVVESYFNEYVFEENYFDLIVASFSLHHCNTQEKQDLFKKFYTALKQNGVFTCSDLMVNKNTIEHEDLLLFWNQFVHETFPDGEKWEWLMEHYNEYDKPDPLKKQLKHLQKAGFKDFKIEIRDNHWVHFKTKK